MKYLSITMLLLSQSLFAADFSLSDPSILGEYTLSPAKKKSEVQSAKLRINPDNKLVLEVDRNTADYELTGPDDSGLVFNGDDEPNCDGDEPACYYDAQTTISLDSVKVGGKDVPQLTLKITEVNAFDDEDGGTINTYVLRFAHSLPDGIPFYTNTKLPAKLASLIKDCENAINPKKSVAGHVKSLVCTRSQTYEYRGSLRETLKYLFNDQYGTEAKKPKQITEARLKKSIFPMIAKAIKSLGNDEDTKNSVMAAQSREMRKYVLEAADRIYYIPYIDSGHIYVVDEESKLITLMRFKIH